MGIQKRQRFLLTFRDTAGSYLVFFANERLAVVDLFRAADLYRDKSLVDFKRAVLYRYIIVGGNVGVITVENDRRSDVCTLSDYRLGIQKRQRFLLTFRDTAGSYLVFFANERLAVVILFGAACPYRDRSLVNFKRALGHYDQVFIGHVGPCAVIDEYVGSIRRFPDFRLPPGHLDHQFVAGGKIGGNDLVIVAHERMAVVFFFCVRDPDIY